MNVQADILRSNMLACAQWVDRLNLVVPESRLLTQAFESIGAYLERKGFAP